MIMRMLHAISLGTMLAVGSWYSQAVAVLPPANHLKCYKIKDPAKIKGTVDLTTPQFGAEPGCVVGAAKYFCAPASKTNVTVTSAGTPVVPLPLYAPAETFDRICYKVKCPTPPPPFPPDQNVTDQFGNRTLMKFTAAFMCTPAVVGAGFCGNGVIDPGEDCDGAALGACTVGCRADCTCMCETACCYVENVASPPDTQCFQYSGNPAQVAAFQSSCTLGAPPLPPVQGSLPVGTMRDSTTPAPAPCAAGPTFGFPCVPGPPGVGNLHVLPSDSTCP
jgi:hypothetical protein